MQIDDLNSVQRALEQRNKAIACAILSVVLSLAMIMNTFLGHRKELAAANRQILNLQKEINSVEDALRANQRELTETQEALSRERDALARARSH